MSTGDFETRVRQSVADHLALIATAAEAAKNRIVSSADLLQTPAAATAPAVDFAGAGDRSTRPAVDFSANEPSFNEESAFADGPSQMPDGAITFDDLAVEGVDDDGIPVWEDTP